MKNGGVSSLKKKNISKKIKARLQGFTLTAGFTGRMRWVLFVASFLLLYVAFQEGDDWFVREFANYDWARSIGF